MTKDWKVSLADGIGTGCIALAAAVFVVACSLSLSMCGVVCLAGESGREGFDIQVGETDIHLGRTPEDD